MNFTGTRVMVSVLLLIVGVMFAVVVLFPVIGYAHLVFCFVWGWFIPEMSNFIVGEE